MKFNIQGGRPFFYTITSLLTLFTLLVLAAAANAEGIPSKRGGGRDRVQERSTCIKNGGHWKDNTCYYKK